MAIHDSDYLAELIETNLISDRINSFVWISVAQKNLDLKTFNNTTHGNNLREALATHLSHNRNEASKIKEAIKYLLTAEDKLQWITGEKRQINWMTKKVLAQQTKSHESFIQNHLTHQPEYFELDVSTNSFVIPEFLTGKNLGIAIFDFFVAFIAGNLSDGSNQSKILQSLWAIQIENDKKFDWFNDKDAVSKRDIFQNLLISKKIPGNFYTRLIFDHDDFLIYLDNLNISELEKETIYKNTRDRWNQQKRRDRKKNTEKQCNFNLPIAINDKLNKLAEKYNLSRVEIIDILIRYEAQKELYIQDWLQKKPSRNPVE